MGPDHRRKERWAAAALVLTSVAFALWAQAAATMRVDPTAPHFDAYLDGWLTAAIVVLAVAFGAAAWRGGAPRALMGVQLALLVVFLHLTPFLMTGVTRFRTNWRNFGYSEFFARHEHADPTLIWYHNWPGFFVEGHHLANALGAGPNLLLGIFPTIAAFAILACALGFFSILFRGDAARAFSAAWLFVAANWINQELFGPQPLAYGAFLMLVALNVDSVRGARDVTGSLFVTHALIILVFAAVILMHPLTSVFYIAGLALLAVARPEERRLVLISVILLLVWLAFGAYEYLLWKLGGYVQELGDPALILQRGLGKSSEFSPEGAFVGRMRLYFTAAICGLGFLAVLAHRAWRARAHREVLLWAGVPFAFLGAFSYDGEIFLRVFLFALAPICFFVVAALTRPPRLLRAVAPPRVLGAAFAVVLLVPAVLHPPIHYGEEHLDFVHAREVQGMESFYERALTGSRVVPLTGDNLVEAYRRDHVGVLWWGFVEWDGSGLGITDEYEASFEGPQYVWLGDGDRQYYELRRGDYSEHGEALARLRASPYPAVYDSGGLRIFFVPHGGLPHVEDANGEVGP